MKYLLVVVLLFVGLVQGCSKAESQPTSVWALSNLDCSLDGIAPEIRSGMAVSGAYIQVLFYDKTYDEDGFIVELAKVDRKGDPREEWRVVAIAEPGEGVSLKGSWGSWMTWQSVRIPASVVNLTNNAYFKIRVKAFKDGDCYVESEYDTSEESAQWRSR